MKQMILAAALLMMPPPDWYCMRHAGMVMNALCLIQVQREEQYEFLYQEYLREEKEDEEQPGNKAPDGVTPPIDDSSGS